MNENIVLLIQKQEDRIRECEMYIKQHKAQIEEYERYLDKNYVNKKITSCTTIYELQQIREIMGYKEGWVYHQAKKLNISTERLNLSNFYWDDEYGEMVYG